MKEKVLKSGTIYKCKITEEFAKSRNKPEWTDKIAKLKFTGLFFRSLKNDSLFFAIGDVKVIEEVKK